MSQRETRLPDFIVIGAQKSGTTMLIKNLRQHPAVHVGAAPEYENEVHFFSDAGNWSKGVSWYETFFDRPHLLQGEKTPEYLAKPVAIERIAATVPDVKLIVLLRNPVDRAYSAWNHYNQAADHFAVYGWEVLNFEEALERSLMQPNTIFGELLERGSYARQLFKVLEHFSRDQLFVGITERWRRAPREEYERLLDFLGLESVEGDLVDHHVREYQSQINPETAAYLERYFAHHNRQLFNLLGEEIPEWRQHTRGSTPIAVEHDKPFGSGYDICFVTTCMGRLEHLKQSLPRMLAQRNACVLVVDYSCPQGTGDWVEQEFDPAQVRVVRVEGQVNYSSARSRNAGALVPASAWVAMIDADTLLPERFLDAQLPEFREGRYYVLVEEPQHWHALPAGFRDLYGLVIARPNDLRRIGGYDEALQGYGGEDVDLRARLRDAGLEEVRLFGKLPVPIPHGDDDRMANHRFASTLLSNAINIFYGCAKRDLVELAGAQLSLAERKQLYGSVQGAYQRAITTGKPVTIKLSLPTQGVEKSVSIGRRLVYVLQIAAGTYDAADLGTDAATSPD